MLVVIGGLLGNGRKALARRLAKLQGFFLYDIEAKKIHRYVYGKDGRVREIVVPMSTDELRIALYKRILEELPKLSKMYPDMIIENSFHRSRPREFFLREASRYFDRTVFVWIDSDEVHSMRRLRHMHHGGNLRSVPEGVRRRRAAAASFQSHGNDISVFKCIKGDDTEASALWELVRNENKR